MQVPRLSVVRPWSTWLLVLALVGCLVPSASMGETVGEHFRKVMAQIDAQCKAEKKGPYLDLNDPEYASKRRETQCDILKLKPYDPLATPEGRFAHSIKLPPPYDKPKDIYKPGMTGEEYFKALCEAEAGEFIFRTIEDVNSVFELRPRNPAQNYMFQHLYAMEDPYGYVDGEVRRPQYKYVEPERYRYFERQLPNSKMVERFFGYDARNMTTMKSEVSDQRKSHYGFTWRGISYSNDRELGIAGGELIVLDLETNDILGFRRGFVRTSVARTARGVNWEFAAVCPRYEYRGGRSKDFDFSFWFIGKVLRTPAYELQFKKLRGEIPWNFK